MEFQEAFNKAYLGVVRQGGIARMSEVGGCCYQTSDRKRCAIGHLLSDEQLASVHSEGLNTQTISNLVDTGVLDKSFGDKFFRKLQRAHDHAMSLDDFKESMRRLAADYNLTMPELPNYLDGEWHDWAGGAMPVPGKTLVMAELREKEASAWANKWVEAEKWGWRHDPEFASSDIIRFRCMK